MSDERPFKGSGGSLRAQIYEDIRDRIHRGALGRNDRLVDVEIAGDLRCVAHAGEGSPAAAHA